MPRYVFVCPNEHVNERFFSWPHPEEVPCRQCSEVANYNVTATFKGSLASIPDIDVHFNQSFGEVVKSRRHLRDLQKRHDTRDYQPIRDREAIAHEAWKVSKRREAEAGT